MSIRGEFLVVVTVLVYMGPEVWASIPKIEYANGKNPYDPGACNTLSKGDLRMVKDRHGFNKLLLCVKQTTQFKWRMMSNSGNSYGNYFDPANSCSSLLDNIPHANSGVYWIKTGHGPKKAWCDLVTDGGGFMLIGVQNSSRTMDVPSDPTLVHPLHPRHWSSAFGNENIIDFRVQIATSKAWSDAIVDWYYRFNTPRKLSNLLLFNKGNCDHLHPGIGDIKFVKDLQDHVVITKHFHCSRFGVHFHKSLGWGKMNECFRTSCKTGFNYLKLAKSGAFSFSVESRKSGIIDNSTKFIGCEQGKCCVCYGPSNDKDYCAPGCQPINGGTVLTDDDGTEIHAWYWVRTSLPKRVWKRCMEYEKTNQGGKIEKWHVDEYTGVPRKGPCSYPGDVRFIDGVAVVEDKESLQKLPHLGGLLSYRSDNEELYLRGKHQWKTMAKEQEVQTLYNELSKKLLKLEQVNDFYPTCKSAMETIGDAKHGVYKIRSLASSGNGYTNVYCYMTSLPGCSGGGWTLVMKMNGRKETFHYHSNYWSNKETYNLGAGMTGFDDLETKLPTYWSVAFKEICVGMKVNNELNFITIPYRASSLYDIIADGRYRATNLGRSKWLSLVQGSDIQRYCNREGFNVGPSGSSSYINLQVSRIGILGNHNGPFNCVTPDSYLGFGGIAKSKRIHCGMPKVSNTCGNAAYCMPSGKKEIPAMGYIFVR